MFYLNTVSPHTVFQKVLENDIYVDKTLMIEPVSKHLGKEKCFLCVTKPRRFGKSVNANMLAAFFSKAADSAGLFAGRKIAEKTECMKHLNQHNVIFISLNRMPDDCHDYKSFIEYVQDGLMQDIFEKYPQMKGRKWSSLGDLLAQTGDSFIFIFDEWDALFYKKFMSEDDKESYLRFLEGLLKNQPYVELAYMTGVLPIAKYTSGSALNMFDEYSFLDDDIYEEFFGFTEEEVKALCKHYPKPSYEEIKYWYDGYFTTKGRPLFNPRSVNCAFTRGVCRNYWTETGPMSEIAECIEHNVGAVRDDIVCLTAGLPVRIKLNGYSAADQRLTNRNEILSAMVVYGFLSYYEQTLRVPNHELMEKFNPVLARESMGEVAAIVEQSREVLEATIHGDADYVASVLEQVHDREIPFTKYNDENSLSCVITLCYLYARDFYRVEREEKSGKGYCDYLFTPLFQGDPAIILELKYGRSAQEAIDQIRQKNYIQKVQNCPEVLLVGINYDRDEKKHQCIIERITKEMK